MHVEHDYEYVRLRKTFYLTVVELLYLQVCSARVFGLLSNSFGKIPVISLEDRIIFFLKFLFAEVVFLDQCNH